MLYYHFITDHLTFCRPWIVHYCPKYIKVLTCAVKAQFLGKSELEMELVDAVIRRFKQVDDELYVRPARWRHFVESLISWCVYTVSNLIDPLNDSQAMFSAPLRYLNIMLSMFIAFF